jgi:hypothetical protein
VSSDQTFAIVLILVVSTIFAVVRLLKGPVGQALARRLGGAGDEPSRDMEIAELRERVAELAERVDFAERVLLKEPEPGEIHAGGNRP